MDPNQFAQSIDQQGQVPAMVAEVARRKALAHVLEQASVIDTNGTTIDLDQAVPQPAVEGSPHDADSDGSEERASDESAAAQA
jgi:trigger factor